MTKRVPRRISSRRPVLTGGYLGACLAVLFAGTAAAQDSRSESFNLYGVPGLVDMPSAGVMPDGTLSTTLGYFGGNARTTLRFQITPRLSGAFRYASIADFYPGDWTASRYYDRSFDLRYQILTEGRYRPSVVAGLQDFIGTGLYGGEYIVATKAMTPALRVTGGLGWGRLGSRNPLGTLGKRADEVLGEGGLPTYDRWFRGDVAAFGGVEWSPTRRLTFTAEYSSDDYRHERRDGTFRGSSPWNFGLDYRFDNGIQLSLYHLYGEEVGAQVTFHFNPRRAGTPGGLESGPVPVAVRPPAGAEELGWTTEPATQTRARATLAQTMARDNLVFEGMKLEPRRATVRMRNPTYGAVSQAIGRTARAMTRTLPESVEEFVIVPVENGMPLSKVTIRRGDLEQLENEAAAEMLARARIEDAWRAAPAADPDLYPRFAWSVGPYLALSVFDPDNPVRADIGARFEAEYRLSPGLVLAGSVTKKAGGNLDSVTRQGTSGLPYVRTNLRRYTIEGDPAIEYLTLAHHGRPGRDLYSRVTAGYLEKMYAGVSSELLWKPVDSRLAVGAEVNYVQPRDFDQLFGLRDRDTPGGTIPTVNGHLSAYYDLGSGFHGQLDVGRYLAGDWGATVSLDREFGNGWRVGAYATFTDVPFDDFGEGSFDKGIRITIPLSSVTNAPTRAANTIRIQSLTRDGGARLNVRDRLYDTVRDYHGPEVAKTWGRFWR
ncbi:MAG: YjbH domain-containing protein [Rhodosalinus sp.]